MKYRMNAGRHGESAAAQPHGASASGNVIETICRLLVILLVIVPTINAAAQCSVSAVPTDSSDPSFSGFGLSISASGGLSVGYWMEVFGPRGRQYFPGTGSDTSTLADFVPLRCLFPGTFEYHVQALCLVDINDGQSQGTIYGNVSGSFTVDTATVTTLEAEILDPPDPQGNLKVKYQFAPFAGSPRVRIVGIKEFDPPTHQGEMIVEAQPGRVEIRATECSRTDVSRVKTIFITIPATPAADVQLHAANVTLGTPAEKKLISGTATVEVPLGTRFSLGLDKIESGASTAVVSAFFLGAPQLESPLFDPAAYESNILLAFDAAASSESKAFQAMHLGSQLVVIDPDDPSMKQQLITVHVVRPTRLGDTGRFVTVNEQSYDLDDHIVTWAHRRGMPPQIVKAIVKHETLPFLNPWTYRYEPLSTDYLNFSPRGQDLRRQAIYAPYRMEYDGLDRGALLVDGEDVHPRSKFLLSKNPKVHFPDSEQNVTARTIYEQNDYWQHWSSFTPAARQQAIDADPALELGWSAQTTLAASYGLMQVLFEESFNYGGGAIGGQRRPYYLFDIPAHVAAEGGGSVPTGTGLWIYKFRLANKLKNNAACAPAFGTPALFDEKIQKASYFYNGNPQYGAEIMVYQLDFLPQPTRSLIQ